MDAPLWTPSEDRVHRSRMWEWMSERGETDFRSFHRWSVDEPEAFWSDLWHRCGVRGERGSDRVLVDGERMPGARWFPECRLDFTENLLWKRDDDPAIVACDELGRRRELTYAELYRQVRGHGSLRPFAPGGRERRRSRGRACVPNGFRNRSSPCWPPRSIGAVWSSCVPGLWHQRASSTASGKSNRKRACSPADGYQYGRSSPSRSLEASDAGILGRAPQRASAR